MKKAWVNFVSRLSGYFACYDILPTEEDVIICLNNYTGREESVLQFVSLILENGGDKDALLNADVHMERYKENYSQMFDDLQNNIQLFGDIDLVPIESIIVPFSGADIDSYDDVYDVSFYCWKTETTKRRFLTN